VDLITLSKPACCISKRSYRCEQDAQTQRPWNRPVLDASTQVFVLSATTPCANHRPHHILLRMETRTI